jgi:hypothetical protein
MIDKANVIGRLPGLSIQQSPKRVKNFPITGGSVDDALTFLGYAYDCA